MKKLKYAFWLIFVVFFGVLIYQNLAFFSTKHSLSINLWLYQKQTPDMTTGAIVASFVGIGVLIMLLFYLSSRYDAFRAKKTIKSLTHTLDESSAKIVDLQKELETYKQGGAIPEAEPMPEALEATSTESPAETDPAHST